MAAEFERDGEHVGHEPHSGRQPGQPENGNHGIPSGSGLGKYRILERIRSTYNATVYKARDTMLDRLVAIKQMTPALMDNPMACGDFRREAQMMARFTGDARHVIAIHELIEEQQGLFIIHEYVDGRWLESHIAKREIDGDRSLRVFGTLAMGIRTLHSLGLVHRDIRPANVLVVPGLGAKIVDLSCTANEGDCSSTPTGSTKYCAPEFLLDGSYDDRIDIYSLGMVMYEVFVGRVQLHDYFSAVVADPRTSEDKWRDWHCEYNLTLPAVSDINPSIPRVLSNLVERMTAKRVDERIGSINEVIETLTRILRDRRMDASRRLTGAPTRDAGHTLPMSEFASPASSGRLLTGAMGGTPSASMRPSVQPWQTTTAIPAMPRTLGPSQMSDPVSTAGVTAFRAAASTTRHRVRSEAGSSQEAASRSDSGVAPPLSQAPTRPQAGPLANPYQSPRRIRRSTASATRPRVATVAHVPTPEPVEEKIKPVDVRRLVRITAALLLLAIGLTVSGYLSYYKWGPGASEPIAQLIAAGKTAYADQNLAAARSAFDQARLDASLLDNPTLRGHAEHWLLLVDAAECVEEGDLDLADSRLKEASRLGADGAAVESLRNQVYRRKDQIRLQKEFNEDLKRGDIASAERRLRSNEHTPTSAAVVDFREQIDRAQKDNKYAEFMSSATAQMDRGDYQAALVSVNHARKLRNGREVDDMEKRIVDRRARDEWIASGNKAMTDGDFATAAEHYKRANMLESSPIIERAAKQANAMVLVREADVELKAGNILKARQLLKNSIWSCPTPAATSMLDGISEAIAAAEQERQADQDVDRGQIADAIAKYERAIPKLPSPADGRVREKLAQARRALVVARADELYQSRDYKGALAGYLEAQKMGKEDPDIAEKIEKTRKRLPK